MISQPVFPSLCFPRVLIIQTLLLVVFALPFAQAKATPVTFNFTGTITQAIREHLVSGQPLEVQTEWLGKPISGSVSIDLARAVDNSYPHHAVYRKYYTDRSQGISAADWVSFQIVNPDGDVWDLPGSVPASSAYYSLLLMEKVKPYNDYSYFEVIHGHETFLYPSFSISIKLVARGDNAGHLLSSLELEDLVVQPQFANINSYGAISYYVTPDDSRAYVFSIDSFTRATSQVPEPNSLLLAVLALGALAWRRDLWRVRRFLPLVFLLGFANAQATPVTFNFTGKVTETILVNGSFSNNGGALPEWYGKPVSGSVTIDLALAVDRSNDPHLKIYGPEWNDDPERASWVSWNLVGPDGVQIDVPAANLPTPGPEVWIDALVAVRVPSSLYPHSEFYVQRWIDFFPDYPKMAIEINLLANGDNASSLINGLDLENMAVQPQVANVHNYGAVFYYTDAGDAYEYRFTVDSLWRANSHVSEPSGLLLAITVMGGLFIARRRCV